MSHKIKEYITYKRNHKAVKRELTQIGASTLPLITNTATQGLNIVNFVIHIMNECSNLGEEKLIAAIIKELADKLETDEPRLYEIIQYLSRLDVADLKKVVTNAQMETMHIK